MPEPAATILTSEMSREEHERRLRDAAAAAEHRFARVVQSSPCKCGNPVAHEHTPSPRVVDTATAQIPGTADALMKSWRECIDQWVVSMRQVLAPLVPASVGQLDVLAQRAYGLRRLPAASPVVPGANPACGCSQETVCAAHEKPNQSVFPGESIHDAAAATAANYTPDVPPQPLKGRRIQAVIIDDVMDEIAHPYVAPTLTPLPVRREVSMDGRNWTDYERLTDPDPFGVYPHWRIWRGAELELFRQPAVVIFEEKTVPTCERQTAMQACGKPAPLRRPGAPALCDACYLDVEREIARLTARTPGHLAACMRMVTMDYNAYGLGAPETRGCSPLLAGGVFNLRADRD